MSDTGTPTAPPPAEATPAPAVPPVAPVAPPAAAAPVAAPPPAVPAPPAGGPSAAAIDPATEFWVTKSDGSGEERVTLQQMADTYAQRAASSGMDPSKLQELQDYAKAMAGDKDAIRSVVDRHLQPDPATPVTPETEEGRQLQALQAEMAELKTQVGRGQPMLAQIEELRERSTLDTFIKGNTASAPYLAKHPQGPALLQEQLTSLSKQAEALGITDLKAQMFGNINSPKIQQIWGQAFAQVEQRLKGTAEIYQGFTPGAPAAAAPTGPTYVDDQGVSKDIRDGTTIPARYALKNGQMVDTRSGNPTEQAAHGAFQEIPGQPVGSPPPPASNPALNAGANPIAPAPKTSAEMTQWMRQRRAEMPAIDEAV